MSIRSSYKKIKPVPVIITMANGQVFEGRVNIGFEDRASDFFATSDRQFIAVVGPPTVNAQCKHGAMPRPVVADVQRRLEICSCARRHRSAQRPKLRACQISSLRIVH